MLRRRRDPGRRERRALLVQLELRARQRQPPGWHKSPTSDTVGFCIDHSKYKDTATPPVTLPACATLPLMGTMTTFGAADLGCVSSTTAGLTPVFDGKESAVVKSIIEKRLRMGLVLPEFPDLKMSMH